jgi:hypothetical protein
VGAIRWGLPRAIESKCEAVIRQMATPDWLTYFVRIMHARCLIGEVMQGFVFAALLIPYLDAPAIREIVDLPLIAHHLAARGSLQCHPAVLRFLARLISVLPEEIDAILDGKLGIVNLAISLAEQGRFTTREHALNVLVLLVIKGTATQIRVIEAETLLSLFLQRIEGVSDRKCTKLLQAIERIVEAFAEIGQFDDVVRLFLENDGEKILRSIMDSESVVASEGARDLMITILGEAEPMVMT